MPQKLCPRKRPFENLRSARPLTGLPETAQPPAAEGRPAYGRRVVPSPVPREILEVEGIRNLVGKGYVVIAAGGGGIPVVRNEEGDLEGVEAVLQFLDGGGEKAIITSPETLLKAVRGEAGTTITK